MKNIKLTYIPVKKSDIFEGLSFYDSLSESFTYTTDSNKIILKDIDIKIENDVIDSGEAQKKIADIIFNSLSKIFYGDSGKAPDDKLGVGADAQNKKTKASKSWFGTFWHNTIWGTEGSAYKYTTNILIPYVGTVISLIRNSEYKLSSTLSNPDLIVSKIKERNYEGFPESIKILLNKLQSSQAELNNIKGEFANKLSNTYNSNEKSLDKIIGYDRANKGDSPFYDYLKKSYFPNLVNYTNFEALWVEIASTIANILLDCEYYIFANQIIKNSNLKVATEEQKSEKKDGANNQPSSEKSTKNRADKPTRIELSDEELRERAKLLLKKRNQI
jgi:hypothetical protein